MITTCADLKECAQESWHTALGAPFYQKRFQGLSFDSTWEKWPELPLTFKADIIQHSPHGFRALPLEDIFHYHESFGTVGKPMSSWYTLQDFEYLPAISGMWADPFAPGKLILNRFPYSFPVPAPLVETIARIKGGTVIPTGHLNWNVSYQRTVEIIGKLQPQILCSLPLEPLILWEFARYIGTPPEEMRSVDHLCLSGGVLTPTHIYDLEEKWQAKVHNIYGSTEASGMASSCENGSLHLHSDHFIFERLQPTPPHHAVREDEPGILVVTSLKRQAMPLIRYFTRDWVRPKPCSCGRPEPAIELLGRMDDTIMHSGKQIFRFDMEECALKIARTFQSSIYFIVLTSQGAVLRIETNNLMGSLPREEMELWKQRVGIPLTLEFVKPHQLLNLPSMLKTPSVFKPDLISDWRPGQALSRRVTHISEALIEWPKYSIKEIWSLFQKNISNWRARRRFKS